jgi:5-methylcytosine-specific restriction endonuclease McrA
MAILPYLGYNGYSILVSEPARMLQRLRASFTRTPVLFPMNALAESKEPLMQTPEERRTKHNARSRAYYASHKEEHKIIVYHWRARHPDKVLSIGREYHARHRAERNAAARTYKAAHLEEMRAYTLAYRAAHPEQTRATKAAWNAAHKEDQQAADAARYAADPEGQRARTAAWRAANPEQAKATVAAYRLAHLEEIRLANIARYAADPEPAKAAARRRRALKANAPLNDFTHAQWLEMQVAYQFLCVYCAKKTKQLTQDHIVALSKGGSHTAANIVPACRSCNSRKQAGPPPCPVQPLLLTIASAKGGA